MVHLLKEPYQKHIYLYKEDGMDAKGLVVAIVVGIFISVIWRKIIEPWLERKRMRKEKEFVSILIDPTRMWGDVLEIRNKKGEMRYYRNGSRISKGKYDEERRAIFTRINQKASSQASG